MGWWWCCAVVVEIAAGKERERERDRERERREREKGERERLRKKLFFNQRKTWVSLNWRDELGSGVYMF